MAIDLFIHFVYKIWTLPTWFFYNARDFQFTWSLYIRVPVLELVCMCDNCFCDFFKPVIHSLKKPRPDSARFSSLPPQCYLDCSVIIVFLLEYHVDIVSIYTNIFLRWFWIFSGGLWQEFFPKWRSTWSIHFQKLVHLRFIYV